MSSGGLPAATGGDCTGAARIFGLTGAVSLRTAASSAMGSETFGVMLRSLGSLPTSQSAALRYLALILPNPCSVHHAPNA